MLPSTHVDSRVNPAAPVPSSVLMGPTCFAIAMACGSSPCWYIPYAEKNAHLAPAKSCAEMSVRASTAAPSRQVRIVRCPLQLRMTERPASMQKQISRQQRLEWQQRQQICFASPMMLTTMWQHASPWRPEATNIQHRMTRPAPVLPPWITRSRSVRTCERLRLDWKKAPFSSRPRTPTMPQRTPKPDASPVAVRVCRVGRQNCSFDFHCRAAAMLVSHVPALRRTNVTAGSAPRMVLAAEPPALLWNSPTMDSSRVTSSWLTRLLPPTSLHQRAHRSSCCNENRADANWSMPLRCTMA